jgi:Domain of unknown function (DUF4396)
MVPQWLHLLAILSLAIGAICFVLIAIDEVRHPQHMWIMNLVWPITALYASVIGIAFYFRYGRLATHAKTKKAEERGKTPPSKKLTPFPVMVAKGALHCGSGCTLGDIIAEWLAFFVPVIAIWLGYQTLFSEKMFAVWILDYIFAFVLGIAFQYFTIAPMRNLSVAEGLKAAVKADTLSLTAWQVGMYGFMAIAQFYLFWSLLGLRLEVDTFEFWFMMQIAMMAGFITAYPVNWWLIRRGLKEKM